MSTEANNDQTLSDVLRKIFPEGWSKIGSDSSEFDNHKILKCLHSLVYFKCYTFIKSLWLHILKALTPPSPLCAMTSLAHHALSLLIFF